MIESVAPLPPNGWRFNTLKTESGRDLIEAWFRNDVAIGDRKLVRAYLVDTLKYLKFSRMELWKEPQFKWFSGAHQGIGEVRLHVRKMEYRFLGCLGPAADQFTLLIGSTKKSNSEWVPSNARDSAVAWSEFLKNNPENVNAFEI